MKIAVLLSLFLFVLSCASGVKQTKEDPGLSSSSSAKEESGEKQKALSQSASGERPPLWQEALEKSRREKKVIVYTGIDPQTREPLSKAFKDRFGLDVEWVVGRGGEIGEKIVREMRAGLFQGDLYVGGSTTAITVLKPINAFLPLQPWLQLPEVKDEKVWFEGSLPFADRDNMLFTFLIYLNQNIAINNSLVKAGEIKSYRDFLSSKWKDKIIMNDPTIPGSASRWAILVGHYMTELGWDYHRALARQNPVLMRDERFMADWLARGKYPILIGVERQVREFKELGMPVELIVLKEGNYGASGYGNVAVLRNLPHPGSTLLFLNWLLSKEGQTIVTRTQVKQSSRLDTPVEHLHKEQVREEIAKAGGKFLNPPDEDFMEVYARNSATVREIYGPFVGK